MTTESVINQANGGSPHSWLALPIKPSQLLVEFYYRFPGIRLDLTADMIKRMQQVGYKIFAVSETGREVSFIRTG